MDGSYFYLDPDYQAGTPLKFSTVSEVSLRETVLFTLTALAFLGVAVGVFVNALQLDALYVNEGEVVALTVTACQMVKPYSTSNATVPKISYTYQANKALSGNDRVSGDCDQYPVGTIVNGMYLRTDNRQSRAVTSEMLHLSPLKRHGERLILFGFPILTGFFAFGGLLNYYQALRRYPRLRESTQQLEGRIVRVQPFRVHIGQPSELQVTYGFRSPSGKYIEREQTYTHAAMETVTLPIPGTPVKIIYADDDTHVML